MPPDLASKDHLNVRLPDAVLSCQHSLRHTTSGVCRTHRNNLGVRKSGKCMILAVRPKLSIGPGVVGVSMASPSFASHVSRIVSTTSGEKMPRIAARRIVAGVADVQGSRIVTVVNQKGNSVSADVISIDPKSTVAGFRKSCCGPWPARLWATRHVHSLPEALNMLALNWGKRVTLLMSHFASLSGDLVRAVVDVCASASARSIVAYGG